MTPSGTTADKSDSEKITINLTPVDLGKIDVLVAEGIYHNRTDLIRTSIRRELDQHIKVISDRAKHHHAIMGMSFISAARLQALQDRGETMSIKVIGKCTIRDDVTPDLAADTIESITVYGVLRAPAGVVEAIEQRRLVLLSGGDGGAPEGPSAD
ncbi:MAG: CopG family transcriptional regulator [Acidimicrobiales bacterium]